jgi:Plavaka transposase
LKKVDALPTQGAAWTCDLITSEGDWRNKDGELMPPEKLELWRRDPIECVSELMGNPMFKDVLKYAPEKAYLDEEKNCHIYDEMWSADWWWDTQVSNVYSEYPGKD